MDIGSGQIRTGASFLRASSPFSKMAAHLGAEWETLSLASGMKTFRMRAERLAMSSSVAGLSSSVNSASEMRAGVNGRPQ